MQHPEGNGTPVLYIGRTVLKGQPLTCLRPLQWALILTRRLLMSYVYIYIYIYLEHLFLMFLDHTRRTTVGRTPLHE